MAKLRGILILILTIGFIAGVVYYGSHRNGPPSGATAAESVAYGPAVTITGVIGSEKAGLLEDDEVKSQLRKFSITSVSYSKSGSFAMVDNPPPGQDFLWPSTQLASEQYKLQHGGKIKQETIVRSPIVLYSWDIVTDALIKVGIVKKISGTYYLVDLPKLVKLITTGKKWSDIGLSQLYGRVKIKCTDPVESSSGATFYALVANTLNGGETITESNLGNVMPTLKKLYEQAGFKQSSSGDLFNEYATMQSVGNDPIIVGYESQLIEYSADNQVEMHRMRILYPRPTAWCSHVMIALDPSGERLVAAMRDKEIQRLAWTKHGWRAGVTGVQNDNSPGVIRVTGIPSSIDSVMDMPSSGVITRMRDSLRNTQ